MTPEETAAATSSAISQLASRFMLDPATYVRGGELGFEGMNFYVAGRGGVLGRVDADVVSAGFVFFNPLAIRAGWEASLAVMEPADAATAFAACGHRWGRDELPDDLDAARLAELAGAVAAAASPAGAPVFAGWRARPAPDDAKARALHEMNLLRELKMAHHGAAVLTQGLTPLEAVMVAQPYMAPVFGWEEPYPDPEPCRERWENAEAATLAAMAAVLSVLDPDERAEFAALAIAAADATAG
ncbi:MAG: SCO6745 family protein [Acidimicrobiales bacterium]